MPKKKGKKLDAKKLEEHMGAYAEKTPGDLLDEAFGRWDKAESNRTRIPYLDRADHIIINGRTASEHLMEHFEKEFPSLRNSKGEPFKKEERLGAYGKFYKDRARPLINQLVTRALKNGETVEVFVPDKVTGEIGKTPMALKGKSFQRSKEMEKPAELNRWQKFWGKLGFYKKERMAIQTYEARQKVQLSNKVARANLCTNFAMLSAYNDELKQHHPEVVEEMKTAYGVTDGNPAKLGEANGFRTNRSSFHAIALAYLATQRDKDKKLKYTNEQLFDMNDPEMQKARADAMKTVYEHYKAGDTEWLVDLQHDSSTVLTDRADEQAKKLDFSNPDLTEQKGYREFALLCDTAFDQSQDMTKTQKQMDAKYGEGTYWADSGKIGAWSQTTREFNKAYTSKNTLQTDFWKREIQKTTDELVQVVKGNVLRQQIVKDLKEDPGKKFSEVATGDLMAQLPTVQNAGQYDEDVVSAHQRGEADIPPLMQQNISLAKECIQNPKQFNDQMQRGILDKRIQFKGFTDDIENPVEIEVRDAVTVEREMKQEEPQKLDDAPVL